MHFPVMVRGRPMLAECDFATSADLKVVAGWAEAGSANSDPAVQDAAEFAGLACKRWRFYRKTGRYAGSNEELQDHISVSGGAEIALMFVARANWHRRDKQLGVCLCRRTWSNGLCMDFLTVAPEEAAPGQRSIAGIGRGLVYFAAGVADQIRAANIWGEATSLSAPVYRHMFQDPGINDFFRLDRPAYRRFLRSAAERWAALGLPASD
jgi:hypothetical protein